MNNLLVAFCASALALSAASAPAQKLLSADNDMKPLSKMEIQDAKVAMAAAETKWKTMTPEQQAAARKAARAKQPWELTALDNIACNYCYDSRQRQRRLLPTPMPYTPNGTPMIGGQPVAMPHPAERQ